MSWELGVIFLLVTEPFSFEWRTTSPYNELQRQKKRKMWQQSLDANQTRALAFGCAQK